MSPATDTPPIVIHGISFEQNITQEEWDNMNRHEKRKAKAQARRKRTA